MSNSIYLKFDWDKIVRQEQWIIDFSLIKVKILEQVYLPQGWDVVVGRVQNQISLTLIDDKTIYYTLFGYYDANIQCITIQKIDYIFLPNVFEYQSIKLSFVASPRSLSTFDWESFEKHIQQPITSQFITKQHASLVKMTLQSQLKPLKIRNIKRDRNSNRYSLDVEQFPVDLLNNIYDQYIIYCQKKSEETSITSFLEHALEIGELESWNQEKNQLNFTFTSIELIPNKKEFKNYKFFLISKGLCKQLLKLKETAMPILVHSGRNKVDYRFVVKQALKGIFDQFHVKPTWSSSSQYLYYSSETEKNKFIHTILDALINTKRPVTAIVSPETVEFLKSKGELEKAVDLKKLNEKIQTYTEIQHRLVENQKITVTISEKIEKVTTEIMQLQQDINILEVDKASQYDNVHKEKEHLKHIVLHQETIRSQLDELESTKNYLTVSYDELKKQLDLENIEEKRLKKSLENVYLQLNEFKKLEKSYLEVFQHKAKYTETQKSLKQLETKLTQYNQLNQNIEHATTLVTSFLKKPVEDQLNSFNEIITIDLTYKITKQVEVMKGLLNQSRVELNGIDEETTYFQNLNNHYNQIMQKFAVSNITMNANHIQPVRFEKQNTEYLIYQLNELLENQPKRMLSTLFRSNQKEWQFQVSDYFGKFMASYKYWLNVATQMTNQKEKINKQVQVKIHHYCMQLKNGLHDKKHETVNQFMRKIEIEISEIYLELFKLNRHREEARGNLNFFDESLDEQSFKDKKSSLQVELTELISTIRNITTKIQSIQKDLDDNKETLNQLNNELQKQGVELINVDKKFELVTKNYNKLFTKYKQIQELTSSKINDVEQKFAQVEKLRTDQQQLSTVQLQHPNVVNLPVLEKLYEKRHEIECGLKWLKVVTPDDLTNISGITVVENVQELSPLALKQITQQADYMIGLTPLRADYLFATALQTIEDQKLLPVIVDNHQLHDESVIEILRQFYSLEFALKKQPHYISTRHVRNNHYITWIELNSTDISNTFEMLLTELHNHKKILMDNKISEPKKRVKLFSDDMTVLEEIHKNLKGYSLRYHNVKFLKQHDQKVDVHIVHLSDSHSQLREQIDHLKGLLLTGKPVVIITSSHFLKQRELEPIYSILNRFKRIKESSREKQWTTSIKMKEK